MQNDHPISSLMLFTLIAIVVVVAGLLLWHLRKGKNRHPMAGQPERNIEQIRREGPNPPDPHP